MYRFLVVALFSGCSFPVFHHAPNGAIFTVCPAGVSYTYGIRSELDENIPSMFFDVQEGFKYWSQQVEGVTFKYTNKNANILVVLENEMKMPTKKTLRGEVRNAGFCIRKLMAENCIVVGIIAISNTFYNDYPVEEARKLTQSIVRHEIGHLFGFTNTNDFTQLMHHNIDKDTVHPLELSPFEKSALDCVYDEECDETLLEWPVW